MNNSIQALAEVAMTFYTACLGNSNSEAYVTLQNAIEQFLQHHITYDQICAISQQITGTSQPIERLNKILETSPEPIPIPDDLRKSFRGNRRKTRAWTQYEDQRLLAGIYRNGIENWTSISKFVGNARTRSQCSQRWYRGLDPNICKDQWTKEDEQKLLELIRINGDKSWTKIASKMGNRSDVQCRYKYRQLQKERAKESDVLISQVEKQENYQAPSGIGLKSSEKNNLNSNCQNCFLINQNPSTILIPQNIHQSIMPHVIPQTVLSSPSITQQITAQAPPISNYSQQFIPSNSLIAPSGSCIMSNATQIIQPVYTPPQLIIQASNSQQSIQNPQQIHISQQIQPQQIQIHAYQSPQIQVSQPVQISVQPIPIQPQSINIQQQHFK